MADLPDARRAFRDALTVHVGSVRPDGSPHVVPLWFVWLEDAIFATCREGSQVLRNVRGDERVALQFDRGKSWTEHHGLLITGRAEVLAADHPGARRALSAWFEKYRGELGGDGFAAYAEMVASPVLLRITPQRLSGWSHALAPPGRS